MKKCFVFAVALILCGYATALAGVANTEHDMSYWGLGSDPNVCGYCHIPHNAAGDKIWSTWANEAQLSSGPSSPIGNMCYTCHDGTATDRGQLTVFNTALQQHKTDAGTDCNICHTVHDNTNGKFLGISPTYTYVSGYGGSISETATYCETCHDATMYPGAEPLGDHMAGSEHPYVGVGGSCNGCHQMHGAADYETGTLTNPILKQDNTDSAYCATCHADHVQTTAGGNMHPANSAAVKCATCHDVHQPDNPGRPSILKDANINSAYCGTCHQATGTANGPAIGEYSHLTGNAFTTIGATPSADQIDDDDDGPDYPGNSEVIVCESCHSAHRRGVDAPLLRISDEGVTLCANCHSNK